MDTVTTDAVRRLWEELQTVYRPGGSVHEVDDLAHAIIAKAFEEVRATERTVLAKRFLSDTEEALGLPDEDVPEETIPDWVPPQLAEFAARNYERINRHADLEAEKRELVEVLVRVMAECDIHGMGCSSSHDRPCNCSRREGAALLAKHAKAEKRS